MRDKAVFFAIRMPCGGGCLGLLLSAHQGQACAAVLVAVLRGALG